MTKERIEQLEDICEKAAPGPWNDVDADGGMITINNGWYTLDYEDRYFISESRTALPECLAEIRRLRSALKALANIKLEGELKNEI